MRQSYPRHIARTVNRCGLLSFASTRISECHRIIHLSKSRCKSYSCPRCRPKVIRRTRARAIVASTQGTWRFWTLTIPVGPRPVAERYYALRNAWHSFSRKLKKQYPSIKYIRMIDTGSGGNCHYHVMVNAYIPVDVLRSLWVASGGGYIINVKLIPAKAAAIYMSKYITSTKGMRADIERILFETGSRRFSTSRNTLPPLSTGDISLILRSLSMQTLFEYLVTHLQSDTIFCGLTLCSDIAACRPMQSDPAFWEPPSGGYPQNAGSATKSTDLLSVHA